MQKIMLVDYLLGKNFNKDLPPLIQELFQLMPSLMEFEFKKDSHGNFLFPERNEITKPFMRLAVDPALANFFIVMQKYLKSPQNYVVKKDLKFQNNLPSNFCSFIDFKMQFENSKHWGSFVYFNKAENDIIITSFFEEGFIYFMRTHYNEYSPLNCNELFSQVINIASFLNTVEYNPQKDNIKDKYLKRFTRSKYHLID